MGANNYFVQLENVPAQEPLYPFLHEILNNQKAENNHPQPVNGQAQPLNREAPLPIYPVRPTITQKIHTQTCVLLEKAREESQAILQQHAVGPNAIQKKGGGKNWSRFNFPINLHFGNAGWNMFNREVHIHHHHGQEDPKNDQNKDRIGLRILVGLIGVVVGLFTAYKVGQVVAEGEDIQDAVLNFEELKGQWKINKKCYEDSYQIKVDEILKRVDVLNQRKSTARVHKLALFTFGLMACGSGIGGALLSSGILMALGAGLGVFTGGVAMCKWGYSHFSKRDQKEALLIERHLNELNQMVVLIG